MIQQQTLLKVADNTGAKEVMCIRVMGGSRKDMRQLVTRSSVLLKRQHRAELLKKGDVVKAVVVRTVKESRRADGSYIRFDENAAVIVRDDKNREVPVSLGPVARELRDKGVYEDFVFGSTGSFNLRRFQNNERKCMLSAGISLR